MEVQPFHFHFYFPVFILIHAARFFLLLVPEGLSTSKRAPVVVDVPGFSESPYYQVALTGIKGFLESKKWIGVVPFGTASTATTTCCPSGASKADCEAGKTLDKVNPCSFNAGSCCGAAPNKNSDDVSFARAMVEYTVKNMCGDDSNAFATGFSNGGMMSNRLGCQAADLFKAVAPVAGNIKTTVSILYKFSLTNGLNFCNDVLFHSFGYIICYM